MLDAAAEVVRWAYDILPSHGFAVLLASLALGALFLPFMIKQAGSAGLVAAVQPQVERIRRDHAGDRATANVAVVELYRRHGLTSAIRFGCLYFVLQLAAVVLAFMVVRGLTTLDSGNGGGPRYIDQGTALWESLKQNGGQLLWFGIDLGASAFTGPDSWAFAVAYLVLPTAFTVSQVRSIRRQPGHPAGAQVAVGMIVIWVIALLLPGAVVLYLLTITFLNNCVVALKARSGTLRSGTSRSGTSSGGASRSATFRKSVQEADRLESAGNSGAAAKLRLDAVTGLVRAPGKGSSRRFAVDIQRNIVAAIAELPSDALAVFAELVLKSPGFASGDTTASVVRAWVRSPRITRFKDDWEIIVRVLEANGNNALTVLLEACRNVGSGRLTPEFRRGLIQYLRDHLDSAVQFASGRGKVALERESVAFQLLTLVLTKSVSSADQLCALGDLAIGKGSVTEGLARYRAAAGLGSSQATLRLAYHEMNEGHRLLCSGDVVSARRHFTAACELHNDPEYLMLWTIAGVLSDQTDRRAELDQLAALERRGAPSPDITFWRAIAHLLRAEKPQAIAFLRRFDGSRSEPAQAWGPRAEGVVLLAMLEDDDSVVVDWARRLTRISPTDRPVAGPADPWSMLAAVARGERGLLAEMMAVGVVPERMPPWARIAGAHALLTRSTEQAAKGFVGEAARDAELAQRLLKTMSTERIGEGHESRQDQLRAVAVGLRAVLAKSLSPDEAAYAALIENGERQPWTAQAEDIWGQARDHDLWRRHHLAVLHHARAYDLEMQGNSEAGGHWTRALEHWRAVHKDDTFWHQLALHLGEQMGTEIDPAMVADVRQRLPRDLLEPHRDLIVAYRSTEPHRAKVHMHLLTSAPFDSDVIDGVRSGLVCDVIAQVPKAVKSAVYEPLIAEVREWLSIDPKNAHLLQALLVLTRSANEQLVGVDDDFVQIERNVTQAEQLVRPAFDAIGPPLDYSPGSVRKYAAKLGRLRPEVPSRAALAAEIARHEFWNGFVCVKKSQRQFAPEAGSTIIRTCERVASSAVAHFALARLIDPQLTLNPLYQHLDTLDSRAETVWGLCLMSTGRSGRSDLVGAAQHFRRATALEPGAFDSHLLLAQSLVMSGDTSPPARAEALQAISRAEELLPETNEPGARSAVTELKQALLGLRGIGTY